MSEHATTGPDNRNPKSLKNSATFSMAKVIVDLGLPVIKKLEDATEEERNALKSFKTWYWDYTGDFLGGRSATVRRKVGEAFLDVLDVYARVYNCKTHERFLLQLLFSPVVGEVEGFRQKFIEPAITYQLLNFLRGFIPFQIEEFVDMSIYFDEPLIMKIILNNSPHIKNMVLGFNLNDTICHLNDYAPNLKILCLEIEHSNPVLRQQLEALFFYAFFEGKSKAEVRRILDRNETVDISFKSLKQITLRCDVHFKILSDFAKTIFHCYRSIKFTIESLIAMPFDLYMRTTPFLSAILRLEPSNDPGIWLMNAHPNLPQLVGFPISDDTFSYKQLEVSEIPGKINDYLQHLSYMQMNLSTVNYGNVKHVAWVDWSVNVSESSPIEGESVTHLFILGSVKSIDDGNIVMHSLNVCSNMTVLSLMINSRGFFPLLELKPLNNLKVFKIRYSSFEAPPERCCYSSHEHEPRLLLRIGFIHPHILNLICAILSSAPNLKIIELPYHEEWMRLLNGSCLKRVHTWCITGGNVRKIVSMINQMPSIRRLILMSHMPFDIYLGLKKIYWKTRLKIIYTKGRDVYPHRELPIE